MSNLQVFSNELSDVLAENEKLKQENKRYEKYLMLLLAKSANGLEIKHNPKENFFTDFFIGFGENIQLFKAIENGFCEVSQEEIDKYFE